MKAHVTRGLAVLGLLAALAPAASAQTPAITFSSATSSGGLGNPPFTLGFEFTANSALSVSALGVFDDGLDGLVDSYDIGIFDSMGSLLASTNLGSGTSGALVNQFRYVNIAPVNLMAGQNYRVGALYLTGNDPLIFTGDPVNDFATDPSVTFVGAAFAIGGTLSDPNVPFNLGPGYFGPNLLINPTVVPEPGSVALLVGIGLSGASFLRRRRK